MSVRVDICNFLAPHGQPQGVDLCLPRFGGESGVPARLRGGGAEDFGFPSSTFAERDARSAMHVVQLVGSAVDDADSVEFLAPEDFAGRKQPHRVGIVFGSRSNHALSWLMAQAQFPDLVRFEFSEEWVIVGRDGRRFALRDPSKLDRGEYSASVDYGVVARVSGPLTGSMFLLSGLGGRATEGCGLYLSRNWRDLQAKFGEEDFAVVLRFKPPVSPERCEPLAWYHR